MAQPPTSRPALPAHLTITGVLDPFPDGSLDVEDLLLRVLPALQADAGQRWHEQRGTTVDGHRRHAAVERVVADLELASCTAPVRGDLVVVCPEGERHVLPARMAAEVWRRRGWRVRLLGPSLPTPRLLDHLARRSGAGPASTPVAVVVSCSTPASLPGAARITAVATGAGLPVLAGGAGFGPDERRAALVGATAWAADAVRADGLLEAWRHEGAPAAPPAPPVEDAVGLLELEVAAVHGALRRADVAPAAQGLLHHAVDVAAAREVVADDRVLDEAVAWLATAAPGPPPPGGPLARLPGRRPAAVVAPGGRRGRGHRAGRTPWRQVAVRNGCPARNPALTNGQRAVRTVRHTTGAGATGAPRHPGRCDVLAKVLCSLVLCLVVGFLAEPTTSTEVDVREGRGVVVVDAGAPHVRVLAVARTAGRLLRTAIAQVVMAVAAAATVALALHLRLDGRVPRDPSALVAAARAPRRGPPSLA